MCPTRLLNHWHRHASHERVHHMAVPEYVRRYLPPRELLAARDLLDPGLFCQLVYGPEEGLGAQVTEPPTRKEPLLAKLNALFDSLQCGLAHSGGPEWQVFVLLL